MRRRALTFAAFLAAFLALGLALPLAASANAVHSSASTCWFGPTSAHRYTPLRVFWERSKGGGSRHYYKLQMGTDTGSGNDVLIYSLNIWQSYTAFGPAVRRSYIMYPNDHLGAKGATTPVQPTSRMPFVRNGQELHLNAEFVDWWGNKCRRQGRVYTTGITWDG